MGPPLVTQANRKAEKDVRGNVAALDLPEPPGQSTSTGPCRPPGQRTLTPQPLQRPPAPPPAFTLGSNYTRARAELAKHLGVEAWN